MKNNKKSLNRSFLIACSASLAANVAYLPTCLCASVVYVQMCLRANVPRACQLLIFTCQQTCHMACQCFKLACRRAKRFANFSSWRANVTKSVPIFQNSSCEMLREISMIYYYIKNSTFYLISLLYISYVKILQLRGKFQTAKMPCSRFIWTTNSINHRRV